MEELNIFWFRRDLRLYDNSGLSEATNGKLKVIPLFIFDTSITDKLPLDAVSYTHLTLPTIVRV